MRIAIGAMKTESITKQLVMQGIMRIKRYMKIRIVEQVVSLQVTTECEIVENPVQMMMFPQLQAVVSAVRRKSIGQPEKLEDLKSYIRNYHKGDWVLFQIKMYGSDETEYHEGTVEIIDRYPDGNASIDVQCKDVLYKHVLYKHVSLKM